MKEIPITVNGRPATKQEIEAAITGEKIDRSIMIDGRPATKQEVKELVDKYLEHKRANEKVDSPPHYTSHPSGVECIDIAEHFGFSLGNAIKYIWRAGLKGDAVEDLEKAVWYLQREIRNRRKTQNMKK